MADALGVWCSVTSTELNFWTRKTRNTELVGTESKTSQGTHQTTEPTAYIGPYRTGFHYSFQPTAQMLTFFKSGSLVIIWQIIHTPLARIINSSSPSSWIILIVTLRITLQPIINQSLTAQNGKKTNICAYLFNSYRTNVPTQCALILSILFLTSLPPHFGHLCCCYRHPADPLKRVWPA